MSLIQSPTDKINGEIFNVGSNDQNFQILPLAKQIAIAIGIPFRKKWYGDPDSRSYRVNFDKIKKTIGYQTKFTVSNGAKEIISALQKGKVTDSMKTYTVEWYKFLFSSKKLMDSVLINEKIL